MIRQFLSDEAGATVIEYGLIVAILGVVAIAACCIGLFFYLMGVMVGAW